MMDIPYYKETYFQVFVCIYTILGIITAIACYKTSKKNQSSTVLLWTIIGYLFPIIPYIYLKLKYKV